MVNSSIAGIDKEIIFEIPFCDINAEG